MEEDKDSLWNVVALLTPLLVRRPRPPPARNPHESIEYKVPDSYDGFEEAMAQFYDSFS